MTFLLYLLLWWLTGVAGFIFWWTKEHDLRAPDLALSFFAGLIGIFSWFVGWCIHGDMNKTYITTKREDNYYHD